jgi:ABC-2 type transport system permease protein
MIFQHLASRNAKELARDPLAAIFGLAMPVALLLLFVAIGRSAPVDTFKVASLAPSVAIFSFSFLILFSGMLVAKDRQSAFLTRLLTTPLKPRDFILAYLLPDLPIALCQVIVCYLVGAIFGFRLDAGALATLAILAPAALICIFLGLILGSLFDESQIGGIASLLINVIGIFSGAWMPLDQVGGVIRDIAYAMPFAHAVDAARALGRGASFASVSGDFWWTAIPAMVLFLAAIAAFRLSTRRK